MRLPGLHIHPTWTNARMDSRGAAATQKLQQLLQHSSCRHAPTSWVAPWARAWGCASPSCLALYAPRRRRHIRSLQRSNPPMWTLWSSPKRCLLYNPGGPACKAQHKFVRVLQVPSCSAIDHCAMQLRWMLCMCLSVNGRGGARAARGRRGARAAGVRAANVWAVPAASGLAPR